MCKQLKGCASKDVNNEVNKMIDILGLPHKRKALSHTLSGGQKRKLSVGIALIAGSKVSMLIFSKFCDEKKCMQLKHLNFCGFFCPSTI